MVVSNVKKQWLDELREFATRRPVTILRFDMDEWWKIENSRRGSQYFTVARGHTPLSNVVTPCLCLIFTNDVGNGPAGYLALLSGHTPVTTLESRLTIERAHRMTPSSEAQLADLVTNNSLKAVLGKRLSNPEHSVIHLSPKLSVNLVDQLAKMRNNRIVLRGLMSSLDVPKSYDGNVAIQHDAIGMALRTFGVSPTEGARLVALVENRESALTRVNILEDSVIENDARVVSPFTLASSDLTGRAVFVNGAEQLEIITANKRPLEKVFGVDLIYYNALKQNIVMVQYKMLEPNRDDDKTDWLYRPNKQFGVELRRMRKFGATHPPGPHEYRINREVFYLKFVRRDAQLGKSSITMPIGHFEVLRKDPRCKGSKGAFRVSYDALDGRYLRQEPFIELIRSGYIGAHADTTSALVRLVAAVLRNNRAVVAAIHSARK